MSDEQQPRVIQIQVRNVQRLESPDYPDAYDCELFHPTLQEWIPFTATHDDIEPFGVAVYDHIKTTTSLPELPVRVIPPPRQPIVDASKVHMMRVMRAQGMWSAVKQALARAPEDVREDWDAASRIRRDEPFLAAFVQQLGFTNAQVDQLFAAALESEFTPARDTT